MDVAIAFFPGIWINAWLLSTGVNVTFRHMRLDSELGERIDRPGHKKGSSCL
ncbi:MAG: hypothetical protein LBI10_08275 [Deltaproteobacteria bacterium]|nr:hypothetical protein [Deltaproteobacteria bacterium]